MMTVMLGFPFWPLGPILPVKILLVTLAVTGMIFSIVMLTDCLKRKASEFPNAITKNAEYDKLIWAVGIIISLWFYFLGAILYFFVVKKSKPAAGEEQ